jgi:hypothetical protein
VEARLALVGPNLITHEGHPSIVQELWARAKNPLNALLLSLAVIFYFLSDVRAAVVISVIGFSPSSRPLSRSITPMTPLPNSAPW